MRVAVDNMSALLKSPYWLAVLAGALQPFAFAPFAYWWLLPLSLALLMWLQFGRPAKQAFLLGVTCGTTGFIGGLYWIYISTHVYSAAPALLSLFLVLLLSSYLSLYGALAAALASWLGRGRFLPWLLSYVLAWPLLEWLRGQVFDGFPWLSLGYSQTDTWLSGWAPYTGVFAMAIPVLLLAALPLAVKQGRALLVGALLLLCYASGYWGQTVQWTEASGEPIRVALVQGNIEQADKWRPEYRWSTAETYFELTEQVLAEADLIVWPEVAVPGAYRTFYPMLFEPLQALLAEQQVDLLAGVMRWNDATEQYANSVVQLNGGEPTYYDKQHLVPFAEFFPVPNFIRGWLADLELPYSDLYTGKDNFRVFDVDGHKVAASICFEDAFGNEIAELAAEAGLLVSVSNDAWFGRSIAAPQHEQIARMRALEMQRWIVRSTPTGYSAFISPEGKLVQRLARYQKATAVAELQPRLGITPYMQLGNRYLWLFLLPLLGLFVQRLRRASRQALD